MPYSSTSELPKQVAGLPAAAKRVWMTAYNNAGSDIENKAAYAWGAVKRNWRKSGNSWVKKAEVVNEQAVHAKTASRIRRVVREYLSHAYVSPAVTAFRSATSLNDECAWITPGTVLRVSHAMTNALASLDKPEQVRASLDSIRMTLTASAKKAGVPNSEKLAVGLSRVFAECVLDVAQYGDPDIKTALTLCRTARRELRRYGESK